LLRYLAIAHFGRGSGAYEDRALPEFWLPSVTRALGSRQGACHDAWSLAQASESEAGKNAALERLAPLLGECAREVLLEFYPGSGRFLEG